MDERKAVQRTIGRMCREFEKRTGRLPDRGAVREFERKAVDAALRVDRRRGGR